MQVKGDYFTSLIFLFEYVTALLKYLGLLQCLMRTSLVHDQVRKPAKLVIVIWGDMCIIEIQIDHMYMIYYIIQYTPPYIKFSLSTSFIFVYVMSSALILYILDTSEHCSSRLEDVLVLQRICLKCCLKSAVN